MTSGKNKKRKIDKENDCDCPLCKAMDGGEDLSTVDYMEIMKDMKEKNIGKVGFSPEFFRGNGLNMTMRTQGKEDLYYDAMDFIKYGDFKNAEKSLKKSIRMDEDYVEAYVGFYVLYDEMEDYDKSDKYIKVAFEKTLKKFPKWPKEMSWYELENRQYLRAIFYRAGLYIEETEKDKGIELYRLLLEIIKEDNLGVRYLLASIYRGMDEIEFEEMFDEANITGNWKEIDKIVKEENKIHKFWEEK